MKLFTTVLALLLLCPLATAQETLLTLLRSDAVPQVTPDLLWRGGTQLEISWSDMPVTVQGGSEDFVFTRRSIVALPGPLSVDRVDSFAAYDRGDTLESVVAVYDQQGRVLHRRSPHKELGLAGLYRPFQQQWYRGPPVTQLTVDLACRVTASNAVSGSLSARCHFLVTVLFTRDAPDPDPAPTPTPTPAPACEVPHSEDPGWVFVDNSTAHPQDPGSRNFRTRHQLEAAKGAVGDRTGQPWLETLALLAEAVNAAGGCSAGPWDDEVVILADDGLHEGYHAVSSRDGGYTGRPERSVWSYDTPVPPPGTCGLPLPPALHHFNLKCGTPWCDSTPIVGPDVAYCAAVGFTDGRSFCAVRPDCSGPGCEFKDRVACERLVVGGDPLWRTDGRLVIKGDNPSRARCCLPSSAGAKCRDAPSCSYIDVCTTAGFQCARVPRP